MLGKSAPLLSSFKLSYYTLLTLLRRIEGSGACMLVGSSWLSLVVELLSGSVQFAKAWLDSPSLATAAALRCFLRKDAWPCAHCVLCVCLQVPTWSL